MRRKRISKLITELQRELAQHGDLFVYFVSSHDWAQPITAVEVAEDSHWEGAPKEKTLYIE